MAVSTSAVPLDCSPFCVRASLKEGIDAAVSTFAVSLLAVCVFASLKGGTDAAVSKRGGFNFCGFTWVMRNARFFASVPLLRGAWTLWN